MSKARLEWKVGLFVLISIAVLVGLIVRFSKGAAMFTKTYQIQVIVQNVGGIIPGASVLMAGVPIGTVENISLNPDGKSVTLHLEILSRYRIHADASISIKQAGFLGDRYVSIDPTENAEPLLEPGQTIVGDQPLDLYEVARSAVGLIARVDETTLVLKQAVQRIDRTLLAEETLRDLTETFGNFRELSERSLQTLTNIEEFVRTNTHPLSASVSNLAVFSSEMKKMSEELHRVVSTNRADISGIFSNAHSASASLDALLAQLRNGDGLMGALLSDSELREEFDTVLGNLSLLSSNLNRHGLLYRPRNRDTPNPTGSFFPGRNPHR